MIADRLRRGHAGRQIRHNQSSRYARLALQFSAHMQAAVVFLDPTEAVEATHLQFGNRLPY